MLTQEDDVEIHALARRGWSVSAIARHTGRDRKTVAKYLAGKALARVPAPSCLEPFRPYLEARFEDDAHVLATRLFEELVGLGFDRSYPTLVREIRELGLRPVCECCWAGGVRLTVGLEHAPGEELQLDWLELSETPWAVKAYVSLCMDGNRRAYALAALHQAGGALTVGGSSAIPASFTIGGGCASAASFVGGSGLDPIPGFRAGRDDMGVDASANPGQPIIAPAASTLVEIAPNWYQGQPLMLLQLDQPLAGTLDNDQYWYVAEQIDPVTVQTPTAFQARQVVAHFAPSGTCIERWGDPTSTSRTLAAVSDPASAHPPRGRAHPMGRNVQEILRDPLGRPVAIDPTLLRARFARRPVKRGPPLIDTRAAPSSP